ncbi:hypothetical protein [Jannaschia seohaensis]|nr:hypothetical protein [Jannaschia seohaensis]
MHRITGIRSAAEGSVSYSGGAGELRIDRDGGARLGQEDLLLF